MSITRVVGCCEDLGRSSSDRSGLDETAKPNLPAGWAVFVDRFKVTVVIIPSPIPEMFRALLKGLLSSKSGSSDRMR